MSAPSSCFEGRFSLPTSILWYFLIPCRTARRTKQANWDWQHLTLNRGKEANWLVSPLKTETIGLRTWPLRMTYRKEGYLYPDKFSLWKCPLLFSYLFKQLLQSDVRYINLQLESYFRDARVHRYEVFLVCIESKERIYCIFFVDLHKDAVDYKNFSHIKWQSLLCMQTQAYHIIVQEEV